MSRCSLLLSGLMWPRRMSPVVFAASAGMAEVSQVMVCVDAVVHTSPAAGEVTCGLKTMSSFRFEGSKVPAGAALAADAAAARTAKKAVSFVAENIVECAGWVWVAGTGMFLGGVKREGGVVSDGWATSGGEGGDERAEGKGGQRRNGGRFCAPPCFIA